MLELNYKYPKLGYGILREAHMKRIILIGLMLALSGCLSPQQIRQQQAETCAGYGFRQGTPQFSNCLIQQNRQASKEELCRQVYFSAFGMAPPEKGFAYQSGVATKAQADCLQRP